jgi:hypothetical protein
MRAAVVIVVGVFLLAAGRAAAEPPKLPQPESAKLARAKADLNTLTIACSAYKIRFGEFPEKLDKLFTPPQGLPIIEPGFDLKDPWGHQYEYDRAGKQFDGKKPDIWATVPGGEKLGNWAVEKKK